jgi:hypothetical protein
MEYKNFLIILNNNPALLFKNLLSVEHILAELF